MIVIFYQADISCFFFLKTKPLPKPMLIYESRGYAEIFLYLFSFESILILMEWKNCCHIPRRSVKLRAIHM